MKLMKQQEAGDKDRCRIDGFFQKGSERGRERKYVA